MAKDYYLVHHGIKGQKWGLRRFQNEDGTLTAEGRERYGYGASARYNVGEKTLTLKDDITGNKIKINNVSLNDFQKFNDDLYEKGLKEYLKMGNDTIKSMGIKGVSYEDLLLNLDDDHELLLEAEKFVNDYSDIYVTEIIEKQIKKGETEIMLQDKNKN